MADLIEEAAAGVASLEQAHAKHANALEQIKNNVRLSEDAKRADTQAAQKNFDEAHAQAKGQIVGLLEQATAALGEEEADLFDAVRVRPSDAAAWTSAAAQDRFIGEDVRDLIEGAQGNQIAVAFRRAMKRGDTAQAFLIARHGKRELGARAKSSANPGGTERERLALDELNAALGEYEKPDAKKMQSVKDRRARAAELKGRVGALMSYQEIAQLKQRFHQL